MDTDKDLYRTPEQALRAVIREEDFPSDPVDRIEVHFLASGELTWRAWPARADEPIGGYLAPPAPTPAQSKS